MTDIIEAVLEPRYKRGDLEVGVSYVQVNETGRKKVGKFLRTGYLGSGDGMEIVVVFEKDGKEIRVQEQAWGDVSGNALSYFVKDTEE